jgi:hypothetical protein
MPKIWLIGFSKNIMFTVSVKGKVWKYYADKASWYFLTLGDKATKLILEKRGKRKGWGSVRVEITLGDTIWRTSVFPDKKKGFILPIKASVRKAECVNEGDTISIFVKLI